MKNATNIIILFLFSLGFNLGGQADMAMGQTFTINGGGSNRMRVEASNMYQEAQSALRGRRLTEARQLLQRLIEDYPDDIYASLAKRLLADILRDLNEYEEAIRLLKEMLESDASVDNQSYARKALLDLYYDLQRFREGVELIESWRKSMPNDIWLEKQLARFYLQTGRKDEAWMVLETMLERTASATIFQDLLELAMKTGEVEKLLNTLESRKSRFKSRDFSTFSADCYLALGRKDKAIEVIKATPDLSREWQLLKKLADLQIETGSIEDAYSTLVQVDNLVKDEWDTLKKMGHCLFLLGRKAEAIEVWRRPFARTHMQRQDQYLNYTTVLIEHQLLEEALKGFEEARKRLGNPTMFAEEVASVLEALGRNDEALNEYIQVFANGIFKLDAFDKLYESMKDGFDLETRLRQQLSRSFSIAVRQALLELYFRSEGKQSLEKIVRLINSGGGTLDDFFYERLHQEAIMLADNFQFELCRLLIKTRPDSTLALRLAMLMLDMAKIEPIYAQQAFNSGKAILESNETVDADLEAELLVKLAQFAFEELRNPKIAHEIIDRILQSKLFKVVPQKAVEAAIFKAHIMICEENYAQAESLLKQNHENVEKARENIFAANPIGETDYLTRILLEMAFLAVNQGDFQKALDLLKGIVENYPESLWTNDALEQAMFITRASIGDFSLIKNLLKARRLSAVGKTADAGKIYENLIAENASLTVLISEIQAEEILNSKFHAKDEEVLKNIGEFTAKHPRHFMSAELKELEFYYLRKKQASEKEIKELLQKFIETFPDDLRSGRYRMLLEKNRLMLSLPDQNGTKVLSGDQSPAEELLEEPTDSGEEPDLEQIAPGQSDQDMIDLDDMGGY